MGIVHIIEDNYGRYPRNIILDRGDFDSKEVCWQYISSIKPDRADRNLNMARDKLRVFIELADISGLNVDFRLLTVTDDKWSEMYLDSISGGLTFIYMDFSGGNAEAVRRRCRDIWRRLN